jgi:AraC-like DNA-binding protein
MKLHRMDRNTTSVGDPPLSSSSSPLKDEVEARLQATLAFMHREFRRNPRLGEIARVAHFSEYHFHRLFRKRFGKTPKHLLVELQIEDVKQQMLAGHRPSEAARRAGFAHQSHLTSRFRQATGMTPRQWLLAARERADHATKKR